MVPAKRLPRSALLTPVAAALAMIAAWTAWSALAERPVIDYAAPEGPFPAEIARADESAASSSTPAPDSQPQPSQSLTAAPTASTDIAARVAIGADDPSLIAIEVLVREGATGTPIPGAEVFYPASEDALNTQLELLMTERGFGLELLRRVANTSRTGADGRARLRCRPGKLELLAVSATMWGGEDFTVDGSTTEPLTVNVQPMVFVQAQVVDETGRPLAGIPVWMHTKARNFLSFRYGGFTSGREGLARLGPLDAGGNGQEWWIVGIDGALSGPASAELDLHDPPKEPVRLVLDAHGSVEVRLVCRDGKLFTGAAEVELDGSGEEEWSPQSVRADVSPGSGAAVFERVGIGLGVKVSATIAGISHLFEASGRGPRRAGERAVIEVKLGRALPVLVGRAVDELGEPLRNRALRLAGHLRKESPAAFDPADVMTDAAGNFTLATDCGKASRVSGVLLLRNAHSDAELGAAVRIPVTAGRNDLGRITFAPACTIATGVVVDESGAPVSQASVMLAPEQELTDTARGWAPTVQSGAQGEFDLRGWAGEGLVRILANHSKRSRSGTIDVALGSKDARLAITARRNVR
jgi:hypothetical protein